MVLSALFAFSFGNVCSCHQACPAMSFLGNSSDVDANIVYSLLLGMPFNAHRVRNTVPGNDENVLGAET